MNYLAHLYLSFDNPQILVGNFIADAVKGNKYKNYPPKIEKGILIHRQIDHYTDNHKIPYLTRKLLQPVVSKYSGVVQDVFYDHFLAINWHKYSAISLNEFCSQCYKTLEYNHNILPLRMQTVLYYMRKYNWLSSYQSLEGIDKALKGLSQRTKFSSNMENATLVLEKNYQEIESHFFTFFPDLEKLVKRISVN